MAKPTANKSANSSVDKSTGNLKIFGLLNVASSMLSLGALGTLFAGTYDLGFIDLTHILSNFAAPALLVLIASSLLVLFSSSKISTQTASKSKNELVEFQSRLKSDIAAVEEKVKRYLGDGYDQLKAENDQYKKQIEEVKDQRRQNLEEEIETLKTSNAELHDRISNMAKNSDESTVFDDRQVAA